MGQTLFTLSVIFVLVVLSYFALRAISRAIPKFGEVTGFERNSERKTLWDYLGLVGIPVVLAVAAYSFSAQQTQFSQAFTAQQNQNSQSIAANQQRETILENYLDTMSDLLLNHDLKGSKPGDAVRDVAKERTKVVLAQIDPDRMALVVGYLYDQGLISGSAPIIDLTGVYLV